MGRRLSVGLAAAVLVVPAHALAGTPPFQVGSAVPRLVPPAVPAPTALIPAPRVQPDAADGDGIPLRRGTTTRTAHAHLAPLVHAASATSVLEGLTYNQSGGDPPDVTVAAGAGDVVEMTNVVRRVWTEGGAVLDSATPLYQMFGTNNDILSDPRVFFDAPSGRWFASLMNISKGTVVLAVSTTSNPLDAWRTYSLKLNVGDDCFDQPKLGSADGMILVSASAYARRNGLCAFVGFYYTGGVLFAVNKQDLVAGNVTKWDVWGPDANWDIPVAAQALSPSAAGYAITNYSASVGVFTITGTPPGAQLDQRYVRTAEFANPPQGVQPGSSLGIATNDARLLDAYWLNGQLWTAGNASCRQGDGNHACARVVAVDTALGSVVADTPILLPGGDTYYPALRPDQTGNVVVAYGASSPTVFPSMTVIIRAADGTWGAPQYVRAGTVALNLPRFGDYFGAARDPVLPNVVWVGGEYIGPEYGYQTAIGAIRTVELAPAVDVVAASAVTKAAATLGGFVDPRGGDSLYWFEWGTTPAYGHATAPFPATAAGGRQQVQTVLAGLKAGTTYHWRLVAKNDTGTTNGPDATFRTSAAKKKR